MIITTEKGRGNKIHISVDDTYALTVDSDFWYSQNIASGEDITEEAFEELKSVIGVRRAFNKALDLLSRRDHCRRELEKKLSRFFEDESITPALEKLELLNLINDENYARKLTEELLRLKKFSPSRIRSELIFRGISRDIADDVVSEINIDECQVIVSLLNTKFSRKLGDEKGRKSVFSALIRLGYNYSDINSAMRELNLDELD